MVDPTADVKKDPFFIDYILYKRIKYLAQHDKDFKFKQKLSKKEKEQIKLLFAPYTPASLVSTVENALKEYTQKTEIQRKMIKK